MNLCKIIVGWKQDGTAIFASYGFSEPMTPTLLRRLARSLEFSADEWLDERKDATSPAPHPDGDAP